MTRGTQNTLPVKRVRPLLLVLLWVWALCVFLTLDLFLNISGLDAIRPRAPLYTGMRMAGHEIVGEPYFDGGTPAAAPARGEPRPPEPPRICRGNVYAASGAPLSATVTALDSDGSPLASCATDATGSFSLSLNGACDLSADAPGYVAAVARAVVPPAHVDLVLVEGERLAGRAVDTLGEGVRGVVLRLEPRDELSQQAPVDATTDALGRYMVEGVRAGEYDLVVAGGPVRVGARVPVVVPALFDVEVLRAEPIVVFGIVCEEETGSALAGAEVSFPPSGAVLTDGKGGFRMEGLQPGSRRVEIRARGRPTVFRDADLDAASEPLDLRVAKGCEVKGRVVDASGAPVPEACVAWTDGDGTRLEAAVGPDGAFVARGLLPGGARARVLAKGFAKVTVYLVPDLLVVMEGGARLSGRVLGPDGEPLACVPLRLVSHLIGGGPLAREMDVEGVGPAWTDARGQYVFEDLPAGATAVVALPFDLSLAPAVARVVVAAGADETLDLRVGPARPLEGRVTDKAGRPVEGALVQVTSRVRSAVAFTDGEGRFVLRGLPPLLERILVTKRGYGAAFGSVAPSRNEPLLFALSTAGGP